MPPAEVRAYRDAKGNVPVKNWLDWLESHEPKAYAKCLARILELADKGYEMRRPHADFLRDGIYELRASFSGVHYRILYFFYGKDAVALSHGITKEREVPNSDIDIAIARMKETKASPDKFTADIELER
jgi:phage-related protein